MCPYCHTPTVVLAATCVVWNDSHDCGLPNGHTGDHVCAGCGDRWNRAPWDEEDSEEFAWQRDDVRCVDQ